MASAKKTLELDLLSLKALNFKNTLNQNIPSSFVLYALGNGQTAFSSISSIIGNSFDKISVPGQATISSSLINTTLTLSSIYKDLTLSTSTSNVIFMNITTYPSFTSTIQYTGLSGSRLMSTTSTVPTLSVTGTTIFSSVQLSLSNFIPYMNPNGSTRAFLDYTPSFQFPTVVAPSSISSVTLFPDSSNLAVRTNMLFSTNLQYYDNTNSIKSMNGQEQYMAINSLYPYGISTNTRLTSNTYNQPMKLELNTQTLLSLSNKSIFLDHYVIDAMAFKVGDSILGSNVSNRSGFETRSVNILGTNPLYLTITNTPS
uniref:Uncharacterized protein n=1 Tax=viral metagenome TaxID=1070528 RepID=A0A6C0IG88_9ZZZZ